MALDVEITQGSYWGGAQIPYWLYMIFVIFPVTGVLGVDHLLLRSPITALLKLLSFVPLFGFWYFYDIAQLGEGDLIKKNGIGIPFYGPGNIGKGMFFGNGNTVSPEDKPRPWIFTAYVLASIIFLAFPINKIIVGDYYGALVQLCMLIIAPLALAWSIYDIYRIIFDTRGVMEKGTARIPPASFLMNGYFTKAMDVLGPKPADPEPPGIIEKVTDLALAPAQAASNSATALVQSTVGAAASTMSAVNAAAKTAESLAKAGESASAGVGTIASSASRAGPALGSAIQGVTKGGALFIEEPSSTTVIVLFGVALLAFSGYAYSAMRNLRNGNVEKDDSPPKPGAARTVTRSER